MRKKVSLYLIYGFASALIIWALQELFLFLFNDIPISESLKAALYGALCGSLFCGLIVSMDGFFSGSKYLYRRGLRLGILFGLTGGMVSFYIIEQIVKFAAFTNLNPLVPLIVFSLRWLTISLCIGFAIGFRDKNHLSLVRSIISGLISGVLGGLIISLAIYYVESIVIARGIGIIIYGLLLAGMAYRFSFFGRKSWLKVLNGKLEGMEIELTKEIHMFGTQDNDDINLQDYQEVQQSHAKLIRYFDHYSLVDNDPFCQTFVNFRTIKEQFLKNGDILKIGTALFQYCTVV